MPPITYLSVGLFQRVSLHTDTLSLDVMSGLIPRVRIWVVGWHLYVSGTELGMSDE